MLSNSAFVHRCGDGASKGEVVGTGGPVRRTDGAAKVVARGAIY